MESWKHRATEALDGQGQASKQVVDALLRLLQNNAGSSAAADALGALGHSSKEIIDALLEVCNGGGGSSLKASAASCLINLGYESEFVVDTLSSCLFDDPSCEFDAHSCSINCLGHVLHHTEQAVDALLECLEYFSIEPRYRDDNLAAALSLLRLAYCADGGFDRVVDGLLSLFKVDIQLHYSDQDAGILFYEEDEGIMYGCVMDALLELAQLSDAPINGLLDLLKDDRAIVRARVTKSLGELENDFDRGERFLTRLEDDEKDIDWVVDGLLAVLLEDENENVRSRAAISLFELGTVSYAKIFDAVRNCLRTQLEDENEYVRCRATVSLFEFGKVCDVVLNRFLALSDFRAAVSLVEIGKVPEIMVDWLRGLLSGNLYDCPRAAVSLTEIEKVSDIIANCLRALLQDESGQVRCCAAVSLVELGKVSDAVVNCLLTLLDDKSGNVRSRAVDALVKLRKQGGRKSRRKQYKKR